MATCCSNTTSLLLSGDVPWAGPMGAAPRRRHLLYEPGPRTSGRDARTRARRACPGGSVAPVGQRSRFASGVRHSRGAVLLRMAAPLSFPLAGEDVLITGAGP